MYEIEHKLWHIGRDIHKKLFTNTKINKYFRSNFPMLEYHDVVEYGGFNMITLSQGGGGNLLYKMFKREEEEI